MTPFVDRFIQVGSVRTRYWDVGTADAPYGLPRLAQFAVDFLSALGVQRAHIAGNSLGGAIAMECAHLAPERVASMLLVDPAGVVIKGALLEFRLTSVPVLGELFSKPTHFGTRMLWNKAVFKPAGLVTDELVATKVKLASQPGAQRAFLKTLRSFLGLGGFTASHVQRLHTLLPTLTAPTLVLWGKQDLFVAPAHAEVLRRLLPNAKIEVWDACGHVPQMEHPQRFNETALAFWGRAGAN
jgi:pimeloyl-ACP methyl ester carboxylesterase